MYIIDGKKVNIKK